MKNAAQMFPTQAQHTAHHSPFCQGSTKEGTNRHTNVPKDFLQCVENDMPNQHFEAKAACRPTTLLNSPSPVKLRARRVPQLEEEI